MNKVAIGFAAGIGMLTGAFLGYAGHAMVVNDRRKERKARGW